MLNQLKQKLVNWLLKDVHLDEVHIGGHSVVISDTGVAMGNTKVSGMAAPTVAGDALRKGTRVTTAELPALTDEKIWKGTGANVEEVDWPDLATHAGLTTAHGAVSAATASKIVVRDVSARAKFAAPAAAGDALIKGTALTITEMAALTTGKMWVGAANRPTEIAVPILLANLDPLVCSEAEADAKIAAAVAKGIWPSDNLRNSNDTERTTLSTSYVKLKEVRLNADLVGCRLKFSLRLTTSGPTQKGRIYKNNSPIGTEQTINTVTTLVFSQDFAEFANGDLIQIWGLSGDGLNYCRVLNMRFYYNYLLLLGDPTISITNQDP